MRMSGLSVAALGLAGAGLLFASLNTDYDKSADFSKYHT